MNILINFFASLYDFVIVFFASLYDLVYSFFTFLFEYLKWITNIKSAKPKDFSTHKKEKIQVRNQSRL